MRGSDGFLALADLGADRAEWYPTISITYRGRQIVTGAADPRGRGTAAGVTK